MANFRERRFDRSCGAEIKEWNMTRCFVLLSLHFCLVFSLFWPYGVDTVGITSKITQLPLLSISDCWDTQPHGRILFCFSRVSYFGAVFGWANVVGGVIDATGGGLGFLAFSGDVGLVSVAVAFQLFQ